MNDSSPPGGPAHPHEPVGSGRKGFFAWLRGLGITRSDDRWFTGVAAGIAERANIDPLIVRGIFVVLAILGGPGILLYLAGWLLLPDSMGKIHIEEIFRGRASASLVTVSIIIGAIVVLPFVLAILGNIFGGLSFGSWGPFHLFPDWLQTVLSVIWWVIIVPAAIVMLIIWLSTRKPNSTSGQQHAPHTSGVFVAEPNGSTAQNPSWQMGAEQMGDGQPGDGQMGNGPTNEGQPREGVSNWADRTAQWGERVGQEHAEVYEATRPGAAHTVLTLALALLVGGAVSAWAYIAPAEHIITLGLLAAVTVFAFSMIVAGVRGRRSGWTGFFAFCGVIALLIAPFSTVLPGSARFIPFGSDTSRVVTEDGAVAIFAGNSTVNLRGLDESSEAREFEVWVFAGNVVIELPDDHPVQVHVNLAAGNIRDQVSGEPRSAGLFLDRTVSSNTAGVSESDITQVHVRLIFGNVRVDGASGSQVDFGSPARAQMHSLTPMREVTHEYAR